MTEYKLGEILFFLNKDKVLIQVKVHQIIDTQVINNLKEVSYRQYMIENVNPDVTYFKKLVYPSDLFLTPNAAYGF